jgi:hypothetical protein
MPRQSSRSVVPDPFKAIDVKDNLEVLAEKREVRPEELNDALIVFRNNLTIEEYNKFEGQLREALDRKDELRDILTKKYYNKQNLIIIVLNVFAFILPSLIKANIPENIVSSVMTVLRIYNFQLINYYIHFFVDHNNKGIEEVQETKTVTPNLHMKIQDFAFAKSPQLENFANGHYKLMQGLISIKDILEKFMVSNKIFVNDSKNRLIFVFLYLAIFIVMLYIAMHFNSDEFINFINIFEKLNTTPVNLLGSSSKFEQLNGGKKNSKSNNSTKPKKRAAVIKKASPKKVIPKKASPKKVIPKKASPKKASPKI